jgi:hypothetical protein
MVCVTEARGGYMKIFQKINKYFTVEELDRLVNWDMRFFTTDIFTLSLY